MRLVFMGTPQFAVTVLQALCAAPYEVVCVYTQPPRPAGRGKSERQSPVHTWARDAGLPVRHPTTLRAADTQREFASLQPDVAVVAAYGLILPQPVLGAPARGCLNVHASLLPRWRGAAPIQRAIMAGDRETGVSIMQMQAGLDTGPVLLREALAIGPAETAGELHDRLAALGARLMVTALERLDALRPEPQSDTGITYATKITKPEARVDWTRPAVEVDRLIRGLAPSPGAWCDIGGERVRLLRSRAVGGAGAPGEVLSGFVIACGEGAVEITEAQREGRRALPAGDVLRGLVLPARLA